MEADDQRLIDALTILRMNSRDDLACFVVKMCHAWHLAREFARAQEDADTKWSALCVQLNACDPDCVAGEKLAREAQAKLKTALEALRKAVAP